MVRGVTSPGRRYVWAAGVLITLGTAWYAAYVTIGAGTEAIAYVFVPVGAAVCAAAVFHMTRERELDRVARRFWQKMLFGFTVVAIGYGWLAEDMLTHYAQASVRSMPVPAAGLVVLGFAVAIWAVARAPTVPSGGIERWRVVLDRAIAFLGCATLLWYVGLAPMITSSVGWSRQAMVIAGIAFLLTVGAATKVSYMVGGPVDRMAIRFIAASGGVVAAGVAILAVRVGPAGSVPAQAIVMPLAPVLATLGVSAQWRARPERRRDPTRGSTLLPYAAVAAVDLPLIAVAFGGPLRWPGRLVVLAAVVVTTLVTFRQYIAFRENARLLREKRIQEARLQHEVTHDGLTGLANRALFRQELTLALTTPGPVSVLLVDLDDFKAVNDSLGHDVGDRLLVSFAELLRTEVGSDRPSGAGRRRRVRRTGRPAPAPTRRRWPAGS